MTRMISVGVLVVSDRAAQDASYDKCIQAVQEWLAVNWPGSQMTLSVIVPDDEDAIKRAVNDMLPKMQWLIVSGGTGMTRRDVTFEAVELLLSKRLPALEMHIQQESLKHTPFAVLSRVLCGCIYTSATTGTLVTCLPGKIKAVCECMDAMLLGQGTRVIEHLINMLNEDTSKQFHAQQNNDCSCDTHDGSSAVGRVSHYPMVEVVDVLQRLNGTLRGVEHEVVTLSWGADEWNGHVLAEDVMSPVNVPAANVSRVDGYAFDSQFYRKGKAIIIGGESSSLVSLQLCAVNGCVKITTGSPLPHWADAVVPVEDAKLVGVNGCEAVLVDERINSIQQLLNVRVCGSDISRGQVVLPTGSKITAHGAELAALLSAHVTQVKVIKPPTVAIMSSGNEMRDVLEAKSEDAVDTNRPILVQLSKQTRAEVIDMGLVNDNADDVAAKFEQALDTSDMVITSGGVSMGDYDLIKPYLERIGAEFICGRVNIKPGKPTTVATVVHGGRRKFVFALPGNPVSCITMWHCIVAPVIDVWSSPSADKNALTRLMTKFTCVNSDYTKLANQYKRDKVRPELVRVRYTEDGMAEVTGNQVSSRLLSWCGVDALVLVPSGVDSVHKGERMQVVKRFT